MPIYLRCCLILFCLLATACNRPHDASARTEVAAVGLTDGVLSDDGNYAIVGSLYHSISLWRLSDNERIYDWSHKSKTNTTMLAGDFSPDGKWALTADAHTLVLWDVESGEAPRFWSAPGEILSTQLSQDARFALLGLSDHSAVLFDIRKGGILRTLNHNNRVRSVALSENGKIALSGSEDYSAIVWDLETNQALAKMQHNDDVQIVALSDDGELAFSASKYDRAILWQSRTGELLGELDINAEHLKRGLLFTAARFSKDGRFLLTGTSNKRVTLWRVSDFKEVSSWEVRKRKAWKPSSAAILDVAFTNIPGTYYTIASNGFVFQLQHPEPSSLEP